MKLLHVPNAKRLDKNREQSKVIEFLMGLNHIHEQVRSNIFRMRRIPEIDVVYDMIVQNESQKNITRATFEDISSMYVQNQGNVNHQRKSQSTERTTYFNDPLQGGNDKLFCTRCQMNGHTKEYCWNLHGYPKGGRRGGRGAGRGSSMSRPMSNLVGFNQNATEGQINSSKGKEREIEVPSISHMA